MATMEDWKMALAGHDLDEDLFAHFIPRDGNDSFLQEAFSPLPNGQEFIEKIKRLLDENDNTGLYVLSSKENYLQENKLKEMLSEYCRNIALFFESNGRKDLAESARQKNIQTIYNNNDYMNILRNPPYPYSEIEDEISDLFRDQLIKSLGEYRYCLKESVLFLTKYNGITQYLLEDVVGFPLKSKPYYDLWKAGGDVSFFQDRILLLCEYGQS